MVRAGETYTLPREMSKDEALAYWMGAGHEVSVAEEDGEILRLRDGDGTKTRACADDVRPFDRTRESTLVSGDAVQFCGGEQTRMRCGRGKAAALRLWGSCRMRFAPEAGVRGCVGDVSRALKGSVAIEQGL